MDLQKAQKLLNAAFRDRDRQLATAKSGEEYYHNRSKIKQTGAAAIDEINRFLCDLGKNPLKSADNRIPTNYHKVFVDQKIGYLFTYPPQLDIGSPQANDQLAQTLGSDFGRVLKKLGLDASNWGRAWLHYYIDEQQQLQYHWVSPEQILPVYDVNNIKLPLKYLIRTYAMTDDAGETYERYEIWDDKECSYFLRKTSELLKDIKPEQHPEQSGFTGPKVVPNRFGRIPFIEFRNNADATSDLEMYQDLIDVYDKVFSGFANDIDDIQEIIYVIKNYQGQREQTVYDKEGNPKQVPLDPLQMLKASKWIGVDENGGLEVIHGDIPHEARSKFIELLKVQLYIAAMAVDPNPDKIGNASGAYLDYLYQLLELKAGMMETEFRPQIDELIRVITQHTGLGDPAQIEQTWTRNKPKNYLEIVQMITQTPSTIMSDETKTKEHPLVDNWQDERERIEKEEKKRQEEMMKLPQFGGDPEDPVNEQ